MQGWNNLKKEKNGEKEKKKKKREIRNKHDTQSHPKPKEVTPKCFLK